MDNWIANAVGIMHIHKITQKSISQHLNCNERYLSAIFNGKRKPKDAEHRIMTAIDEIIAERNKTA